MGRRNWCNAYLDETTGELLFDIRVEKEKGHGVTVGSVFFILFLSLHMLMYIRFRVLVIPFERLLRDGNPLRMLSEHLDLLFVLSASIRYFRHFYLFIRDRIFYILN